MRKIDLNAVKRSFKAFQQHQIVLETPDRVFMSGGRETLKKPQKEEGKPGL